MLSDEELLRLYQDKSFTGSYSGVSNFRHFIFTDFGELIPYNRIYKLLHTLPSYVYQLRSPRHFKTRSYQVDSFGKLMETDLAFMKSYRGFKSILVLVDCYSWHLYTAALKNKSAPTVKKAFAAILDSIKSPITTIASDQGGEFVGNRKFFQDRNIRFVTKHGKHKAAIAEHNVYLLKKRLFLLMTGGNTMDWPSLLSLATKQLNARPMKKLGNLSPADVTSMWDDAKVEAAQKEICVNPIKPDLEAEIANQHDYESNNKALQVGMYVYPNRKQKNVFEKSFNPKIEKIDSSRAPPVYSLTDLLGHRNPRSYYAEELLPAPTPGKDFNFEVEKVISRKTENGKKYVLVRYKHYPPKFDRWILEENLQSRK